MNESSKKPVYTKELPVCGSYDDHKLLDVNKIQSF